MHGHDWSTFSGPSHRGNGLTTFRQAGLRGAHALRGGRGSCLPSSSSFWEEPEPEASKQEVVHGCAVHGEKHWAARVWAVKSRAATATARSAVERPMKHRGSRAGGAEGGPGAAGSSAAPQAIEGSWLGARTPAGAFVTQTSAAVQSKGAPAEVAYLLPKSSLVLCAVGK